MVEPQIIQAGMGIGVSGRKLANTVGKLGAMGVVSGTAIDNLFIRQLQMGDAGGDLRRALAAFPVPEIAERILLKYFVEGGIPAGKAFAPGPMSSVPLTREHQELLIVSNFAEVFLAKEGHTSPVGVNYLEKIQLPILPSLFGAMLADVDYVLMGAGIPREIPGALDKLAAGLNADYPLHVEGAEGEDRFRLTFSPREILPTFTGSLRRPKFLAIIASNALAQTLARKASGKVDGFIIEAPTAGGHNAPPRGKMQLSDRGEPVYGPRDEVDLVAMKELGLPFWLAGSRGYRGSLKEALALGAAGIQVGTAFALCEESGLSPKLRAEIVAGVVDGGVRVFTDPHSSPTGFPFKAVELADTVSERAVYEARIRVCDLGYLRSAYKKSEGGVGLRCSAEPVKNFEKKGGLAADTAGRKCLCNALFANIDLGQLRPSGQREIPLVTLGDDVNQIAQFIPAGSTSYSARNVLEALREERPEVRPAVKTEVKTVVKTEVKHELKSDGAAESRTADFRPSL